MTTPEARQARNGIIAGMAGAIILATLFEIVAAGLAFGPPGALAAAGLALLIVAALLFALLLSLIDTTDKAASVEADAAHGIEPGPRKGL